MDELFVGYVKLVVLVYLIFRGFCEATCVNSANNIHICRSQELTSDRVYIDTIDAPEGNNVTCMCTLRRADNSSQPLELTIRSKQYNFDRRSMMFDVQGRVFYNIHDENITTIVDDTLTAIVFKRTLPNSTASMCLRIIAGGFSAKIQVICDAFPSNSTRADTLPNSSDGRDTLAYIIAGSVTGAVMVVILSLVIIICIRRSRRSKSSTARQSQHVQPSSGSNYYTTENKYYATADVGTSGIQTTSNEEQDGLLQCFLPTPPDNTYAEVEDTAQQFHCEYAQVEKGASAGNVYNITSVTSSSTNMPSDNIRAICVPEDDYNHLHDVVETTVGGSSNIYGAAIDISHQLIEP